MVDQFRAGDRPVSQCGYSVSPGTTTDLILFQCGRAQTHIHSFTVARVRATDSFRSSTKGKPRGKKMSRSASWAWVLHALVLLALSFVTASAQATTIFSDNFNGAASGINGVAPDVRPGSETWVASGQFLANGALTASPTLGGTATLAFTPVNGLIYQLDASFTGVTGATENDWVAIGFAEGQSTNTGNGNRFINGDVFGRAWMLYRQAGPADNTAFLGSAASGTADSLAWTGSLATKFGGDIDLRIVLDTTGGTGKWTATWFAQDPANPGYQTVRTTPTLLNETINSVGYGKANTEPTATITSLTLTAVPEPGTLALLGAVGGMGVFALVRARRRRGAADRL